MSSFQIKCPKCQRVLGETSDDIHARLNCRGCKSTVDVNVKISKAADYLPERRNKEND